MKKKKHHIGSHNTEARPDEKVGRRNKFWPYGRIDGQNLWTTTQRQVVQHVAARKRRQRDKATVDEQMRDN